MFSPGCVKYIDEGAWEKGGPWRAIAAACHRRGAGNCAGRAGCARRGSAAAGGSLRSLPSDAQSHSLLCHLAAQRQAPQVVDLRSLEGTSRPGRKGTHSVLCISRPEKDSATKLRISLKHPAEVPPPRLPARMQKLQRAQDRPLGRPAPSRGPAAGENAHGVHGAGPQPGLRVPTRPCQPPATGPGPHSRRPGLPSAALRGTSGAPAGTCRAPAGHLRSTCGGPGDTCRAPAGTSGAPAEHLQAAVHPAAPPEHLSLPPPRAAGRSVHAGRVPAGDHPLQGHHHPGAAPARPDTGGTKHQDLGPQIPKCSPGPNRPSRLTQAPQWHPRTWRGPGPGRCTVLPSSHRQDITGRGGQRLPDTKHRRENGGAPGHCAEPPGHGGRHERVTRGL